MRIAIVTPAGLDSLHGNRVTAIRWADLLREAGHEVSIERRWDGTDVDLLLALHARRSHESVRAYANASPGAPLILALTGTDLYRDIHEDDRARTSLRLATRLVVLQDLGAGELPAECRAKVDVVVQSAEPVERIAPHEGGPLEVAVIGHLRAEKDPFRAGLAARLLPPQSRIEVVHAGGARAGELADEARSLTREERRYRWLGEVPHAEVRELLARSWLLAHTSLLEGGANVVSEALAASLPVVTSEVPGNVGLLGADHPGYYPPGDETALARLLWRLESEPSLYAELERRSEERRGLVTRAAERSALLAAVERAASGGSSARAAQQLGTDKLV